jgi:hypothetical protein
LVRRRVRGVAGAGSRGSAGAFSPASRTATAFFGFGFAFTLFAPPAGDFFLAVFFAFFDLDLEKGQTILLSRHFRERVPVILIDAAPNDHALKVLCFSRSNAEITLVTNV